MARAAMLAALLLGLVLASEAIDPRMCIPPDNPSWPVKNGRVTNKWGKYYNLKAVKAVNKLLKKNYALAGKACKFLSWEAIEGCYSPKKEGKKPPSPGDYSYRWTSNYKCWVGKNWVKKSLMLTGVETVDKHGHYKLTYASAIIGQKIIDLM